MSSKASGDRVTQANKDVCTSMWLTSTLLRDAICRRRNASPFSPPEASTQLLASFVPRDMRLSHVGTQLPDPEAALGCRC